jgi:hypothetical protein
MQHLPLRHLRLCHLTLLATALLGATGCAAFAEPSRSGTLPSSQAHPAQTEQKLAPKRELLRDKNGFNIGEIERKSDERQELRDKNGFKVGEYDPRSNQTRDKNGFLLGTGNLLVGRMDQPKQMSRDVLRDKNGFLLGEITAGTDGRQTLRDKNGFKLGEYDMKSNQTRDKNGFLVGTGNLLPGLLNGPDK